MNLGVFALGFALSVAGVVICWFAVRHEIPEWMDSLRYFPKPEGNIDAQKRAELSKLLVFCVGVGWVFVGITIALATQK